jgi:hypothetical protein
MDGRDDLLTTGPRDEVDEYDCERLVFRFGSRGISNGSEEAVVPTDCSKVLDDGE